GSRVDGPRGSPRREADTRETGQLPKIPRGRPAPIAVIRGPRTRVLVTTSGYSNKLVYRRPRGTVRGTTRHKIPAQREPTVHWPVPSVEPARSVYEAVLLVNGRSAVDAARCRRSAKAGPTCRPRACRGSPASRRSGRIF